MTKVTYPIPHTIYGMVGRKKTTEPVAIAESLEFDLPDLDDTQAPFVVSADMAWHTVGLPSQGGHDDAEARVGINPHVQLRHYNGSFYAPVMRFDTKFGERGPIPALPQDFPDIGSLHKIWMSPFGKSYEVHGMKETTMDFHQSLLIRQKGGRLPVLAEVDIRNVEQPSSDENRRKVRETALDDLSRFICVDGKLWQKTGEPMFRYDYRPAYREAIISIVDRFRSNASVYTGYFRLDRLDDCLDHVASLSEGEGRLRMAFRNLKLEGQAFKFDDETAALVELARQTLVHSRQSPVIPEAVKTLMEPLSLLLNADARRNVSEIAATLEQVQANWPDGLEPFAWLNSGITRWNLRPAADPVPRM